MLYCYEKKKREKAGYFWCVIHIALADKPFASTSADLNMPKKRNNVTIYRQPAWLSHFFCYVLTM
jgi:hypothetical protein